MKARFESTTLVGASAVQEAEGIVRQCVHCGFCLATCPTYQLEQNELDSPRGRIYLITSLLEGGKATAETHLHLDRCLTCRSCETTCPSGVQYGRLLDIGRQAAEQGVPRGLMDQLRRSLLRRVLLARGLFAALLGLGRMLRPLLPATLQRKIPLLRAVDWPAARHPRRMLALDGCVQPALAPSINASAARVLDAIGISLLRVPTVRCCGALSQHLSATDEALAFARQNIEAWWPHVEAGAEAIVMTASGCGATVIEYGHLLRDDPAFAAKAARISALTRDLTEVLQAELPALQQRLAGPAVAPSKRVAFHSPCTLQHGLKLRGLAEPLLSLAGFELTAVAEPHLCCGSAGTYSILQPEYSGRLLRRKIAALTLGGPEVIATANIGCLTQLQSGTAVPVRHWMERVLESLSKQVSDVVP
jgi:glycolate oxidase iron-sulfur subunit